MPTAQTCVYIYPTGPHPKAYCACRPGYRSYWPGDETKNWRINIPGQEHRVWVAEGVECNELCWEPTKCAEVPLKEKKCA